MTKKEKPNFILALKFKMIMKASKFLHALPFMLCFFLFVDGKEVLSQELNKIVDLRGLWRFTIGDDENWKETNVNTDDWEIIRVPSSWENEGFHGYNGFAWYRKTFKVPPAYKGRSIALLLGRIDDADEVYLNGKLVGYSGSFPPDYSTAYFAWRKYPVQEHMINFDKENVIAVRVYDSELDGGILEGAVGLYEMKNWDIDLTGIWKINFSDKDSFKEKNHNDKDWEDIYVPGYWENQGYKSYDGYAWYRYTFYVPEKLKGKKFVLLAGKIDDFDETFINGKFVGSTGPINNIPYRMDNRKEWQELRTYDIPENVLQFGKENIIAIRVYDGYVNGGIHEGPLAILAQENYTKFWRKHGATGSKNLWEKFWEGFFD